MSITGTAHMCVFRDIRGWGSSALQSPRLGSMAASPDTDSELMPPWLKFISMYVGLMCCAFGMIGVITRGTTDRGTNTREEPRKCGALRSCLTWMWSGQEGRPCWLTLLFKCLTLACASTCSVAISLLITNLSDSDDPSVAVTIKEIVQEALGLDDDAGSRRKRAIYCVKPKTGTSGVLETWETCQEEDSGWQVNIEDQETAPCSIYHWLMATVDSSLPPTCVVLLAQVSMAAAVFITASTISFLICCSRRMAPRHSGRDEREAALEQGIQVGRFAYLRPKTPEEMTRARFWDSCCAWMSPWILYPEEKESVEEITIDSTDKITDVAETRGSREEQLQQDHACTSSKADACTQVTPTVRFEDEATIEACPQASSSETPPDVEVNQGNTDQEMGVTKDTADEI